MTSLNPPALASGFDVDRVVLDRGSGLNPPALASGFQSDFDKATDAVKLKSTRSCERVRPAQSPTPRASACLNPPALASGFGRRSPEMQRPESLNPPALASGFDFQGFFYAIFEKLKSTRSCERVQEPFIPASEWLA